MENEFEGLWIESGGPKIVNGQLTPPAAAAFHEQWVFFGVKGQSKEKIIKTLTRRTTTGGSPFGLAEKTITIYTTDYQPKVYRREGTTFWIGDSEFKKVSS